MATQYLVTFKHTDNDNNVTRYYEFIRPTQEQLSNLDSLKKLLAEKNNIGMSYMSDETINKHFPQLKGKGNYFPTKYKIEIFSMVPLTKERQRYIVTFLAHPEQYYITSKYPYEKSYQISIFIYWDLIQSCTDVKNALISEYNRLNPNSFDKISDKLPVFITNMIPF